jgi:hypothetical protein
LDPNNLPDTFAWNVVPYDPNQVSEPIDHTPRPASIERLMKLPRHIVELIDPAVLRQRLTPEQLRQVRPDLLPPDADPA